MRKRSGSNATKRLGSKKQSSRPKVATVASLGLRVTLVPVDGNREREQAKRIASYEALRSEWERLFQVTMSMLNTHPPK